MAANSNSLLPLIEIAIEPKFEADWERLVGALSKLAAKDPSFSVSTDPESRQIIVGGISESQLDSKVDVLRRICKMDVNVGAPQVAYREMPTRRVEQDYTHKALTADASQFARVKIVVEPSGAGKGNLFMSKPVDTALPIEYVRGVEKGVACVMRAGILAGFPLVDTKVTIVDGAFHDVDSSALAFEIASRTAFREALGKCGFVLLEPIMEVEVVTPEVYAGLVIGDLKSRRGEVQEQTKRGGTDVINAFVPLANMFGYPNQLRSFSKGHATFTMRFEEYRPVSGGFNPDSRPPIAAAMRA